jgi:hypothetical protein
MFTTGIENSYPTIALPDGSIKRIDEMEKAGHYKYWQKDFELVQALKIPYLRYGPPYYTTHLGPGKYDWEFADMTFKRLKELILPLSSICVTLEFLIGLAIFKILTFLFTLLSTQKHLQNVSRILFIILLLTRFL